MIYGIKATVDHLHSLHISKALKSSGIEFSFVSVGREPTAGCDVFIDEKDESPFVYVKAENELDSEQLKTIVTDAMSNFSTSDYYDEFELAGLS